jgi:hypothetical protein
MFYMCLIDVKKVYDDDLGKIETYRSFNLLAPEFYI